MKKVFKVVLRYPTDTEEWIAIAKKYCTFKYGLDRRGRGHGSTASELKAIEKSIVAKFKTIENCRQWLAKVGSIVVMQGDRMIEIAVGKDENSFGYAIDVARYKTVEWKEAQNVCVFFDTMAEANSFVKSHEAQLIGPYAFK